ncbi:hypothetical protein BDZ97DRAFT_1925734 [Flammula alnicola]|nr:hypothetical protein BDZ97DRAFT_1925734 [Flammula alnicola]
MAKTTGVPQPWQVHLTTYHLLFWLWLVSLFNANAIIIFYIVWILWMSPMPELRQALKDFGQVTDVRIYYASGVEAAFRESLQDFNADLISVYFTLSAAVLKFTDEHVATETSMSRLRHHFVLIRLELPTSNFQLACAHPKLDPEEPLLFKWLAVVRIRRPHCSVGFLVLSGSSTPPASQVPSTPVPLTLEQQHVTAVELEGIMPTLQNIVATVNLDCRESRLPSRPQDHCSACKETPSVS